MQDSPFVYRLGRNTIKGLGDDGAPFLVRLQARGWDMGKPGDAEFAFDISLDNPKCHFLQGDAGCAPSVDGLGTLYYSAPLLKLRAGAGSAIIIDGRQISYHFSVVGTVPRRLQQLTLEPLIAGGQSGFFGTGLQYTEGGAVARDMDGVEIGRGFAEGTNWAHATDGVPGAAGLARSPETRALLEPVVPGAHLIAKSNQYLSDHKSEIARIVAQVRGLVTGSAGTKT